MGLFQKGAGRSCGNFQLNQKGKQYWPTLLMLGALTNIPGIILLSQMDDIYKEISRLSGEELLDMEVEYGIDIIKTKAGIQINSDGQQCFLQTPEDFSRGIWSTVGKYPDNAKYVLTHSITNLLGECSSQFYKILGVGRTDITSGELARGY